MRSTHVRYPSSIHIHIHPHSFRRPIIPIMHTVAFIISPRVAPSSGSISNQLIDIERISRIFFFFELDGAISCLDYRLRLSAERKRESTRIYLQVQRTCLYLRWRKKLTSASAAPLNPSFALPNVSNRLFF